MKKLFLLLILTALCFVGFSQTSVTTQPPYSLTNQVSGILPISKGGTNNSSAYTLGSLVFSNGAGLTQNNANLFWDNINFRLGIGLTAPTQMLHLQKANSDNYLKIDAGSNTANFGGILFSEHDINWGWTIRHGASSDNLFIDFQDNTPTFTNVVTFNRSTSTVDFSAKITSPQWTATEIMENTSAASTSTADAVIVTAAFTTTGGTVIINASGSGFKTGTGAATMRLQVDGVTQSIVTKFFNVANQHNTFPSCFAVIAGLAAGSHTVRFINATAGGTEIVNTDFNDHFFITVQQLPF